VKNAEEYMVYRSIYSSGQWSTYKHLATTKSLTFNDKSTAAKDAANVKYTVYSCSGTFKSKYKSGTSIKYLYQPTIKAENISGGIKITWSKVKNAEKYMVYRSTYSGGKWSTYKLLATTQTLNFTDKSSTAKNATNVKYTVYSCSGTLKSKYTSDTTIKYLSQPTVSLSNTTSGVKISWKKISSATKYQVHRSIYSKGKWSAYKLLYTTSSLSYTDKSTTAKSATKVRYTVYAVNGTYKSAYKTGVSIKFVATPTVKTAKTTSGIKVSWTKSSGATKYYLYRSDYSNGKWSNMKRIKITTARSYTDKTAKKGKYYKYAVYAYSGNYRSSYKYSSSVKRK
jgi:hypothetical protein